MRIREDVPLAVLSAIDPTVPLDAVVLFKHTGAQLALWTRNPVPSDVVTVMASTLLASAETVLEALGDARPTSLTVETDRRRILFTRIDSQVALALVAPKTLAEAALRSEAYRLSQALKDAKAPETVSVERVSMPGSRSR